MKFWLGDDAAYITHSQICRKKIKEKL